MEFEAIGTHWNIAILHTPDTWSEKDSMTLENRILERIALFDSHYSRFRSDSLVSQMAREAGTYMLPDDAEQMLMLYKDLYDRTDGKFTPLIGQMLSDAGYDASYSLTPSVLRTPPTWNDVLSYSHPQLTLSQPALLDFGAAGKGYLVDIVSDMIEAAGVSAYVVNAGGDIRMAGQSQRIGLEDPTDHTKIIGICAISKGSICGSAGNRRAWKGYNHIFNPDTLSSVTDVTAVWVTAPKAMLSDALATCLFLVPSADLVPKLPSDMSFEYLIMRRDLSFEASANFPAQLFTEQVST